jgi:hypothetical protein
VIENRRRWTHSPVDLPHGERDAGRYLWPGESSRSANTSFDRQGQTWSQPEPFAPTIKKSYYPGSLTALADGSLVHCWNRWRTDTNEQEPRSVLYSVSRDEGLSWSDPQPLPRDEKVRSVIRHPFIELAPDRWLFSLDSTKRQSASCFMTSLRKSR